MLNKSVVNEIENCSVCNAELDFSNWPESLREKRRVKKCRKCYNAYYTELRRKNASTHKEVQNEWRRKNASRYMWLQAKKRASDKSIPFDIEPEDVIIPEYCPALGLKLERGTYKKRDNSPSLDRIELEKGYVKGNVVVISFKANQIKTNATAEQILAVGEWLKNLASK